MPKVELSLDGLNKLKNGVVSLMLAKALNRIAMDCEAAPDIDSAREVTLKIKCKPTHEVDGGLVVLTGVNTEFIVNYRTPERITSALMDVGSATNGARQLFFQLDAPDNPDQLSLLDGEDESANS